MYCQVWNQDKMAKAPPPHGQAQQGVVGDWYHTGCNVLFPVRWAYNQGQGGGGLISGGPYYRNFTVISRDAVTLMVNDNLVRNLSGKTAVGVNMM